MNFYIYTPPITSVLFLSEINPMLLSMVEVSLQLWSLFFIEVVSTQSIEIISHFFIKDKGLSFDK